MEKHLLNRQHYEDRYDRMTVESCRRSENSILRCDEGDENDIQNKLKASVRKAGWEIKKILLTLDWYNDRESTINEWMQKDEDRDKMLETGMPPRTILCPACSEQMLEDSRTTWDRMETEEVLFFMRCPVGHLPMKGVFEDGTELIIKDRLCPKCKSVVHSKRLPSSKDVVKTKYRCSTCDFEEVDVFTLGSDEPAEDPKYETDKARFCLTGDSLKKAQEESIRMQQMIRLVEEWKHEAKHKKEYDAVAKLKKLTIPQLKDCICKTIEGKGYLNITFERPSIERFVSVEFSLEEMETSNPNASTSKLRKLIQSALADTNWRLMSEGIDYRLGLMTGKIRAYETKEDMLHIVK